MLAWIRIAANLGVVPLVLAALVGGGCGERSEPLAELSQPYPVSVQGAGVEPTELSERPQRIVTLDSGSAELLVALGAEDRLVGAPYDWQGSSVAEVVLPTGRLDLDAISELDPDLIIATPETDGLNVSQAMDETDAVLYLQPSNSIEEVERAALEVGAIVGEPVVGRQLAGSIQRGAEEIDARIAAVSALTVFVDTGFFITVPNESLLGSLVNRSHGENVAAGEAATGPVSPATIAQLNPDVYLATSGTSIKSLLSNPALRQTNAVVNGRVIALDTDLVTRAGPRVVEGFEAIAAALHPDAFRLEPGSELVIEAVTIDAAGTVVHLVDPISRLGIELAGFGEPHSPQSVEAAFRAEVAFYVPRSSLGRDPDSLRQLQSDAVGVFLKALGSTIPPDRFVGNFLSAIEFEPIPNTTHALGTLRAAGLRLACVANWDLTLESHLKSAGVRQFFDVVVSSSTTGAPKPAPDAFLLALDQLGVPPNLALHIGDDEVDQLGAEAAGMGFEPTPLSTLPMRLGLER